MKLILDGGWEKRNKESENNNILVRFGDFLVSSLKEGKKVLIITNAKPAGHYDDRIKIFLDNKADLIDRNTKKEVIWGKYDVILVLGGNPKILFEELMRLGFEIKKLKDSVVYLGSSSGVQIMGSYFYDYNRENKKVNFLKGLSAEDKSIFLVHNNNFEYSDNFLREKIRVFALEKKLTIIPINENEIIEKELN